MAHAHTHDHDHKHDHKYAHTHGHGHDHGDHAHATGACCGPSREAEPCCGHATESKAAPSLGGRGFKVGGMDCAEEVAVLKQAVGPVVGGADRLAFDVLNGRMAVLDAARDVPDAAILKAVRRPA